MTPPLDVVLAGFGGQGILLAGRVLAGAAMRTGLNVLVNNYYEGFVRGGISECTVVMADDEIDSPVRPTPSVVAALDGRALARWGARVAGGGRLVVNTSLAGGHPWPVGVACHGIPATEIANAAGNPMGASLVVVGFLAAMLEWLSVEDCAAALEEATPAHRRAHLPKNIAALQRGAAFASGALASEAIAGEALAHGAR